MAPVAAPLFGKLLIRTFAILAVFVTVIVPVVSVKFPTLLVSLIDPLEAVVGLNNTLALSLLMVSQLANIEELPVTPYLAALLLIKFPSESYPAV
jgi:hypothetical protein